MLFRCAVWEGEPWQNIGAAAQKFQMLQKTTVKDPPLGPPPKKGSKAKLSQNSIFK